MCVCLLVTTANPVKADEQIEMSFRMWTRVCPRNYVLGRGPDPQGEGAVWGLGRSSATGYIASRLLAAAEFYRPSVALVDLKFYFTQAVWPL